MGKQTITLSNLDEAKLEFVAKAWPDSDLDRLALDLVQHGHLVHAAYLEKVRNGQDLPARPEPAKPKPQPRHDPAPSKPLLTDAQMWALAKLLMIGCAAAAFIWAVMWLIEFVIAPALVALVAALTAALPWMVAAVVVFLACVIGWQTANQQKPSEKDRTINIIIDSQKVNINGEDHQV